MTKKAVDVVLLPEETIADKAIELNAKLVEKFGPRIVLNKNNCLPHISLAMGCIDDRDIPDINSILKEVVREVPLGPLEVLNTETETNSAGENVLLFKIENKDELQSLHERTMELLSPFFKYQVTDEMIFDSQVELSTLIWIRDYREKSSYAHFYPHITVGYGEMATTQPRRKFNVSSLALYHLGNHCTCRDVLISIPLKN
ncbi:MAG: 2'-5' RNA ligase family protein [Planctomycetota bacterium]|jgi:2'-5' RNA ligase